MSVLVEAAVESLADALAACDGGADRLELCADLRAGGTTPAESLIEQVIDRVTVPVMVMIRPRGGSFVYTAHELSSMRRDIEMARALEADGVVFGVLDGRNEIDAYRCRDLMDIADGMPVTFHRAFDRVHDRVYALEALIELGVDRVLTSGGAETAERGIDELRDLVDAADGQLTILAGGGVRDQNVGEIVRECGVTEVHLRCESDAERIRRVKNVLEFED
ncbi:MAG TPA: copper homeostasis protein CutC [Gemmatimonadaceae bacterium]|nr:copper homeostasis protein CutC [Gemmatimonadaceae bacterium]